MPWARILLGPMPARPRSPRLLPAMVLVIAASWCWPASAQGAVAIPRRQTGEVLPDATVNAIVGDVDGDGVRELVRLRSRESNPAFLGVEVITVGSDRHLQAHAQAPLDRGAGVEEQIEGGPEPDENNRFPARIDEPARLLAWHLDGAERVIAVAIGKVNARPPCCLTIWQVALVDGATALLPMGGPGGSADRILALDMDADGTDELVVASAQVIAILRWTGDGFEVTDRSAWPARAGPLMALGDSDGLPGDEAGSVIVSGTGPGSILLQRLALDTAAQLRTERAELPFFGALAPLAGPNGGRLAIGSDFERAALLRWPAGAATIEVEERSLRRGIPLGTLGSGERARLVLLRDSAALDVLGADLRPTRLGIAGGVAAASFERTAAIPYVGLLPGGLSRGEAALIFRGRMLTGVLADGQRARLGQRAIASLPGVKPIGVFAADGAWMGLAVTASLAQSPVGFETTRDGGQLTHPAGPSRGMTLIVAETETVLTPEADDGLLEAPIEDGIVQQQGSRPTVLARGMFFARVRGPDGSRLMVRTDLSPSEPRSLQIGASGVVSVPLGPAEAVSDEAFSASMMVLTPSGHGYHAEWDVRIMVEAPNVEVDVPFAPLSFSVPLTGRTDPGAHVSIDGREVAVRADGTFSAQAVVGPVPRDVQVEASDAVGNAQRRTLSVVGFLDYRRLPWIPVVALLTVLAGVLLYVRAPRPAPASARLAGDDARLEEIE